MKSSRRRILLRVLAIVIGGGILLAMLAFGLFRSDPSWYRRIELTTDQQSAGQQRLLDRLATLRNQVGQTQASVPATTKPAWPTYEIELSEDEVNGVLMRWSSVDPRFAEALRHIQEPHVRFLTDRIEFAGRSPDLGTLVSFEVTVDPSEQGPQVQLGRPWAGRLPLSRSLLENPGNEAVAALRAHSGDVPKSVVDALAALIAGDEVTPVVPLMSSLQGGGLIAARVEKLTVKDGVLKASLRPVE